MRIQWALFFCLQQATHFTSASLLRRGRSTVAERDASRWKPVGAPETQPWPAVGFANAPPQAGLAGAGAPESYANVLDYLVAMITPAPAPLNGVYCRGAACQYRVAPPPPTYPPMGYTPPPLPIGGNALSGREFCRGLTCLGGMGAPGDAKLATFTLNCAHLYNDVLGGMAGTDQSRSVAMVQEGFTSVCKKRVGILEVGACPTYANTFMAAVAVKANDPTVGGVPEICTDTYFWLMQFKQAEIDLKLTAASLPKGNSLLASAFYRFGSGGNGPSSPRGIKWRAYASAHGKWPTAPARPQQLAEDGSFAAALLQVEQTVTPKPLLPGADSDEATPRGLPRYQPAMPCDENAKQVVGDKGTKYQIAPGSPDGAVPPVEVAGDLFMYCSNQFSEIMMGFAQTARETVKMTKSWCAWQAGVASWVGQKQEFGHPDWTHRTCSGMESVVSFALRDDLSDLNGGFSAQQVCKKIFLAIGSVHRTDKLVQDAWGMSLRGAPSSGIPAVDDVEMKRLLAEAQEYANNIFSKMRGQKAAYEDLNNAKMDTAAFDPNSVLAKAPPPVAPDLPDSGDLDPTALLALSVERVKQKGGVAASHMLSQLKPWGHEAA